MKHLLRLNTWLALAALVGLFFAVNYLWNSEPPTLAISDMDRLELGLSLDEVTVRLGKPPDYSDVSPTKPRSVFGWNAIGGGIWIELENGWTVSHYFIHENRISRIFRRLTQKIKG